MQQKLRASTSNALWRFLIHQAARLAQCAISCRRPRREASGPAAACFAIAPYPHGMGSVQPLSDSRLRSRKEQRAKSRLMVADRIRRFHPPGRAISTDEIRLLRSDRSRPGHVPRHRDTAKIGGYSGPSSVRFSPLQNQGWTPPRAAPNQSCVPLCRSAYSTRCIRAKTNVVKWASGRRSCDGYTQNVFDGQPSRGSSNSSLSSAY